MHLQRFTILYNGYLFPVIQFPMPCFPFLENAIWHSATALRPEIEIYYLNWIKY